MVMKNSLKQLMRTPVKTLAFLMLLILAVTFSMLGFQLWAGARDNIDRIDKAYMTIGTVEQMGTGVELRELWDPDKKEYRYYSVQKRDGMIPVSVLDFEGAGYIVKPEKRVCYGAYVPGFVMSTDPYWESNFDNFFLIAELQPLEDSVSSEPFCMKVKKKLAGDWKDYVDEIWFSDRSSETPVKFYADKTYIMSLWQDWSPFEQGYLFMPGNGIRSVQQDKSGKPITDPVTVWESNEDDWDEVTEGFYDTPRGKAWLNLIESKKFEKYTVPVIPTQCTKLLMPFYEGDAWITKGRDISKEEYDSGEKVCLVEKDFATNNHLSVGGRLQLPLYFANYSSTQWGGGLLYNYTLLNAKGEVYPVFEDTAYTIVGIYETLKASFSEVTEYDLSENTVVIPFGSVKNSDENNIISVGPMRGSTTSFQIPNGKIDEFMAAWEKQGVPSLQINFYDKGYTKIKAGLDDMMNTASVLLTVGSIITLLVIILFCHLLITKQRKRTAIERSLGMSKKACAASLLTGILVIVIPACVIGSAISFWLSGYAAEQMTAAHTEQAFDTMYSDWVNSDNPEAEEFTVGMEGSLNNAWVGLWVIPAALGIAVVNIRGNLKSEPLRLLGEKER